MNEHISHTSEVKDEEIPQEMMDIINENNKAKTDLDYLKYAYYEIGSRYSSKPYYYLREQYSEIYETNVTEIWEGTSDRPSTIQNYMLKLMLIKSGRFTEDDIKVVNTRCGNILRTPHQYLQVKVDDRWINVDVWDMEKPHKFGELTC
tara:strand:+ start:247 stop:690 length:444 start_codon:yes stop_codon:yes gene_type:complete